MLKTVLMPFLLKLAKSIASINFNQKPYGIFISHAWDFHSEYLRLIEILYACNNFRWKNCSNYQCDITHTEVDLFNNYLPGLLIEQIRNSHCVVIIVDLYLKNKYWIQKEMDIACELNKPVIAIKSRLISLMPGKIMKAAKEIVDWSPDTILNAIKKHCTL